MSTTSPPSREAVAPITPQPYLAPATSKKAPYGEPFAVNFARQHSLPLSMRRVLAKAAIAYAAIHVAVLLLLLGTALRAVLASHDLERQLQAQKSSPAMVSAIQHEIATLKGQAGHDLTQLNTVIAQEQQRFPVAGKLAALAKTVPARTWITSIASNQEHRSFTIQAAYAVDPEEPYALPTKAWIEALKADPVFSRNLKQLELRSSSKKTQGKAELALLELNAEWGQ